jgi:hypothetical protein
METLLLGLLSSLDSASSTITRIFTRHALMLYHKSWALLFGSIRSTQLSTNLFILNILYNYDRFFPIKNVTFNVPGNTFGNLFEIEIFHLFSSTRASFISRPFLRLFRGTSEIFRSIVHCSV